MQLGHKVVQRKNAGSDKNPAFTLYARSNTKRNTYCLSIQRILIFTHLLCAASATGGTPHVNNRIRCKKGRRRQPNDVIRLARRKKLHDAKKQLDARTRATRPWRQRLPEG